MSSYSPTPFHLPALSPTKAMLKLWVYILVQTSGGRLPLHVLAAEKV